MDGRNITILFFLFIISATTFAAAPTVRIRIGTNIPKVSVSGLDLERTLYYSQDKQQYQGMKRLLFNCAKLAPKLFKRKLALKIGGIESPTGLLSWKKNRYRGKLVVTSSPGKNRCDLINHLSLEHYISALLSKEMNSSWPIEVLKAQAIAARTYAYHKLINKKDNQVYDLINSEKHQVTGTFFDETISTYKAAKFTEGLILKTKKGEITPIFFHSKCGGKTFRPSQVWQNKVSGYKSVNCPYCQDHGKKDWSYRMTKAQFIRKLNRLISYSSIRKKKLKSLKMKPLRIIADSASSNLIRIYYGDELLVLEKNVFRKVFGRSKFPSNYFSFKILGQYLYFSGQGNGHGVGMCQYGALELADRGWTYKDILSHYFPGHQLDKIY